MELDAKDFQWVCDVAGAAIRETNGNVKNALYASLVENLSDFFDQFTGDVRYPNAGVDIEDYELTFSFSSNEEEDPSEMPDLSWIINLTTGQIRRKCND